MTRTTDTARLADLLALPPALRATPLSSLDLAFAQLLQTRQPSDDARHLLLAALTSHQWSHGHACLDLDALRREPLALLGWTEAQWRALGALLRPAAAQASLFDLDEAFGTDGDAFDTYGTFHTHDSRGGRETDDQMPDATGDTPHHATAHDRTAALLATAAARLPWCDGDASPLVLAPSDGAPRRLYLRRAWLAEQSILTQLRARLAQPWTAPDDLAQRLDALFSRLVNDAPTHAADTAHAADAADADATHAARAAQAVQPAQPDLQREACAIAASHPVSLITGGPGTGKTTTVVRLLALLLDLQPALHIALAAPTGKAAARLGDAIAQAKQTMPAAVRDAIPTQAQTLHRLLQAHGTTTRLAADVVIVDEASMIDLEMMARLLHAVPATARLILLGDRDQLTSVEAGAVLAQLSDLPLLAPCTVTLRHSHRFDPQRGIGQWAQAVNQDGNTAAIDALWLATPEVVAVLTRHPTAMTADTSSSFPLASPDWPDVTRIGHAPRDAELAALLQHGWRDWCTHMAALWTTPATCDDVQAAELLRDFARFGVLCATHEGPQGIARLTPRIERALHLPPADALGWYVGRPVMVTRNDYALDLMNGDIGLCLPHPAGGLRVAFPTGEGGVRWLQTARLGAVQTVWAMTVHKSQGSEFDHVLLVLPDQPSPILTRELVYTGLTRARQRLTLWAAQPQVLREACARRVVRSGGLSEG